MILILILCSLYENIENFNNNLGINYDFIEIGTSNFDTEIQKANDNIIGLSIEPLKIYLDDLPNKKNVKKINKAISNKRDKLYIYYIEPDIIEKYKLPLGLKGCNSLNEPHPLQIEGLKKINRMDLLKKSYVDVITFEDLVKDNNINKIKYLKVDTEGHDPIIIDSMIEYCDKHTPTYPDKIQFETNIRSKKVDQDKVISKLENRNYKIISQGDDTILIKNI